MPKITELWAWVAEDTGPDDEGVIGAMTPNGLLPLMGADAERMQSYNGIAVQAMQGTGKKIKLVRFTNRIEMQRLSTMGRE